MPVPQLNGQSPEAVASFWLSDPSARSFLNEQLGVLLRAILENRQVPDEPSFSYCPLCAEALSEYEQPDIWVVGLRCRNAHSWFSREGRLHGTVDGRRFTLYAEASDATIAQLIAGWLEGKPQLEPQLHPSVRRVLQSSRLSPKGTT